MDAEALIFALNYHEHIKLTTVLVRTPDTFVYQAVRMGYPTTLLCVKVSVVPNGNNVSPEARTLWKLAGRTTAVPRLLDVFVLNGLCALIMEWIEGVSEPIPLADIQPYCYQLVQAVYTLHQLGIFWRDIKPQNIIWNLNTKHLTILDFDLSTNSTGTYTARVGTVGYMAPEIHQHQPYNYHADIYSIAMTLITVYKRAVLVSCAEDIASFNTVQFNHLVNYMLANYSTINLACILNLIQVYFKSSFFYPS